MSLVRGVAKVLSTGKVVNVECRPVPDQVITEHDVTAPVKLARLLTVVLRDITALKRRAYPKRIDFEDVVVDGAGTKIPLRHGFNGRVRWWPAQWKTSTGAVYAWVIVEDASTDANTLVIASGAAGTVTIRVEEAG